MVESGGEHLCTWWLRRYEHGHRTLYEDRDDKMIVVTPKMATAINMNRPLKPMMINFLSCSWVVFLLALITVDDF